MPEVATAPLTAPVAREITAETAAHLQDALATGTVESQLPRDPVAVSARRFQVHLSRADPDFTLAASGPTVAGTGAGLR